MLLLLPVTVCESSSQGNTIPTIAPETYCPRGNSIERDDGLRLPFVLISFTIHQFPSSYDIWMDSPLPPLPRGEYWRDGGGRLLPIAHRPIKGIHVATGNSRDQLAFDLTYLCAHLNSVRRAPGSDYATDGSHVLSRHLHAAGDWWTSPVIRLMLYTCRNTVVSLLGPLMHLPLKHSRSGDLCFPGGEG